MTCRTAQQIVRAEVIYCVSGLIAGLAGGCVALSLSSRASEAASLVQLCEQAVELATPVTDYEEAALQAGWAHGGDFAGFWYDAREFGSWKAAASSDEARTYHTAEEVCAFEEIEPCAREVYEHWLVTDWLADHLERLGEKIDRDFCGLTIWARTTTGQSIELDAVIEQIAATTARRG